MIEDEVQRLRKRVATLERAVAFLQAHLGVSWTDAGDDDPAPAGVRERLAAGDKIGAIAAYRAATGCGLAEAKARVEELDR